MEVTQKYINKWIKTSKKRINKVIAERDYDVDVRELPHDAIGIQTRLTEYLNTISGKHVGENVLITFERAGLAIEVLKVEQNLYYVLGNWEPRVPRACNEEVLTRILRKFIELHGAYQKSAKV